MQLIHAILFFLAPALFPTFAQSSGSVLADPSLPSADNSANHIANGKGRQPRRHRQSETEDGDTLRKLFEKRGGEEGGANDVDDEPGELGIANDVLGDNEREVAADQWNGFHTTVKTIFASMNQSTGAILGGFVTGGVCMALLGGVRGRRNGAHAEQRKILEKCVERLTNDLAQSSSALDETEKANQRLQDEVAGLRQADSEAKRERADVIGREELEQLLAEAKASANQWQEKAQAFESTNQQRGQQDDDIDQQLPLTLQRANEELTEENEQLRWKLEECERARETERDARDEARHALQGVEAKGESLERDWTASLTSLAAQLAESIQERLVTEQEMVRVSGELAQLRGSLANANAQVLSLKSSLGVADLPAFDVTGSGPGEGREESAVVVEGESGGLREREEVAASEREGETSGQEVEVQDSQGDRDGQSDSNELVDEEDSNELVDEEDSNELVDEEDSNELVDEEDSNELVDEEDSNELVDEEDSHSDCGPARKAPSTPPSLLSPVPVNSDREEMEWESEVEQAISPASPTKHTDSASALPPSPTSATSDHVAEVQAQACGLRAHLASVEETLREMMERCDGRLKRMHDDVQSAQRLVDERVAVLSQCCDDLNARLTAANEHSAADRAEIDEVSAKMKEECEHFALLKDFFESEITQTRQEVQAKAEELNRARLKEKGALQRCARLQADLEAVQTGIGAQRHQAEREKALLCEERVDLQGKLDAKGRELADTIVSANERESELQSQLADLQATVADLEAYLALRNSQLAESQAQFQRQRARADELLKRLKDLQSSRPIASQPIPNMPRGRPMARGMPPFGGMPRPMARGDPALIRGPPGRPMIAQQWPRAAPPLAASSARPNPGNPPFES